jgi:hypothetical protein
MAIDPNIIFQLGKGVTPLLSPTDIQDQQMQREMGGLKLNALRQSAADDAAQRDIYRANTPDQIPNKLLQAGLVKPAMDFQKSQSDQRKSQSDAMKAEIEQHLKKYELAGQIIAPVKDQATWDLARQETARVFGPEAAAQMPAQYDPALIEQKRAQALTVKQQLEQKWKEMEYTTPTANAQLSAQTAQANNAATVATTRRGQDMTDARAREAVASGRVPSGYRQAADGTLEFIPGGPADPASKSGGGKPLTEGQSKALLFGTRMQEANGIFDELAASGVTTSIPGSRAGFGVGAAINALQPADRQRLDQAKRDFLNAVLRRESGAVIADSEFNNGDKQYFPQPGDSDAVISQKKRNREVAMRGILAEVPDGDTRVAQVRGAAPPAPLKGVKGATNTANKTFNIGGQEMQARRAPDGKYYVQQGGKWFEVKE